ncbi:MAG: urease subunit gamma [Chloroflexi bacterium]|nr:urease subunit gamma [Chloroflexota bacterium]
MRLTALEEERLLIFTAAELARRHRSAGMPLNAPEAVALICDAMFESARAGATYAEIDRAGRGAVRADECLEGVPTLVDEVRLEVLMDEGTRLIVLLHPMGRPDGQVGLAHGGLAPGEVIPGDGPPPDRPDRSTKRVRVLNNSERTIRVSSHYPFHRVNQRLEFDREAAQGYRLDVPAGASQKWSPGEEHEVDLVAYGGSVGGDGSAGDDGSSGDTDDHG